VAETTKSWAKKVKPPVPKYHYKLVTVEGSQQAHVMQKALREQVEYLGLSLFAIGHESGIYDVMGDSGASPLEDSVLRKARAIAAQIKKAG
jgi:hypothetical protein